MSPSTASVAADASFGPRFRHKFDFTLDFEHWILTILPALILILSFPAFIRGWYKSTVRCRSGYLLPLKATFVIAFIGLQAGLLALWCQNEQRHSSTSLAAAALYLIASACLAPILYLEHRHTLKSNSFVALWLIITILCDAVKARSAFLRTDLHMVATLTAISGAMKLVLLAENLDETVVGSKGGMLSGGQRHRIALARAVYSRSRYLFLDDVAAALDGNTASIIFERLFGRDGLLKSHPMTVVMTTYSMSHLEGADQIVLIEDNGAISTQPNRKDKVFKAKLEKIISQAGSRSTPEDDGYIAAVSKAESKEGSVKQDKSRQRGDMSIYLFYFRSFKRAVLLVWIFLAILETFTENFPDAYMNIWLVTDAQNKLYYIGYATIGILCVPFTYLFTSVWFYNLVPYSALLLHERLVNTIMRAKLSFITSTGHGVLLNLFSQDMTQITQGLAFSFLRTVLYVLKLVMRSGMIVASTSYTALMIPVLIGLLFVVQMYYLRTSRQMRYLSLESKSPLYAQLTETAEGLRHVRGFGWEPAYFDKTLELIDANHKPEYYMFAIERWLGLVTDLITLFIALILLGITLFTGSAVSSSSVGLGLVSLISLRTSTMEVIQNWTMLETALGALTRVQNLINDTPQERDPLNPTQLPEHWPDAGEVVMRDVVARYNVESSASPALNGVSVSIPAGQKVGVVGRTGGGKSSFLLTILNFLDYTGTITIDNVDIATIPHHVLRSKITTISQDNIDFDASVRANLCPWDIGTSKVSVTDEDIIEMLRRVGLWDLIDSYKGLDTTLSRIGLSHGQKQLLCIARACLHRHVTGSRLVIMDEATSNLDMTTEEQAQQVMNATFADCTVISVAHRLETLADADRIICMVDGQIGEQGGSVEN